MMKRLFVILLIFTVTVAVNVQAKVHIAMKKSVTTALQQVGIADTAPLSPGWHYYKVREQSVVVRVSESGIVEHVGIRLFPMQMRQQMPSPIYDFLEYVLLKKTLSLSDDVMRVNSVTFMKGNWATLLTIDDNMQCHISNNMGRLYEVAWYDADRLIVSLSFPVQYDLLMLSNKEELERLLISELKNGEGKSKDYSLHSVTPDTFSHAYSNKGIYMTEGDAYLKSAITDNLFYRKTGKTYKLFAASQYPAESLANILLQADTALPKTYLTLRVVKYDGTVENVEFTIADWLSCMEKYDCHCYYGFDKEIDGKATAVLYASNSSAGYDHVLMLECNTDQLDQSVVHLTGTAFLYSPTSNVINLFYKYKKK